MKYTQVLAPILESNNIAKDIFEFVVISKEIANIAKAGQFVNIKLKTFLLRRPISICNVDKENGLISLVFEIRGEGTKELSSFNVGDSLDIMGPLGSGFTIDQSYKNVLFVGGGIGTPPLLYLSNQYKCNKFAVIGFRDMTKVILENDFKDDCTTVVTTDDGSYGHFGNISTPVFEILKSNNIDIIYTCGPLPMMKSVYKIAKEYGVLCEVSIEERMGCGVGACLVCACCVNRDGIKNLHVCKDGPVFSAKEVFFND